MPYLEALRISADWFAGTLTDWQGANQGVNAILADVAKVPRDAGDPQPSTVTVIDDTRDSAAALARVPEDSGNVLVLRLDDEVRPDPTPANTVTRNFTVPLVVGIGGSSKHAWEVVRNVSYIARAVIRSLEELKRNENANAGKRRRNGIALLNLTGLAIVPAEGRIGDLQLVAAVRFTWNCRDEQPI